MIVFFCSSPPTNLWWDVKLAGAKATLVVVLLEISHVTPTSYHECSVCPSFLQHWLSELEIFATIFAAAIHDYEHTGTTNNFHVQTRYYCKLYRIM